MTDSNFPHTTNTDDIPKKGVRLDDHLIGLAVFFTILFGGKTQPLVRGVPNR